MYVMESSKNAYNILKRYASKNSKCGDSLHKYQVRWIKKVRLKCRLWVSLSDLYSYPPSSLYDGLYSNKRTVFFFFLLIRIKLMFSKP